ncbi:3D domain-containing protein [Leucothrix arctica]|uniref:3D domain-containing protein n=1 Tax=Leucothrix arctica TaxID=1481894 RepID=UPI001FE7BFF5|nr:3D domain-containing protein [Leucothrix arctica]
MNVILLKRLMMLALVTMFLPLSNVALAQDKSESYDSKQLIRDVAILYRKHKLELLADQLNEKVAATSKANKPSKVAKKSVAKKKLTVAKAKKSNKYLVKAAGSSKRYKTMTVEATAYTSHANQTDSTPNIAAWNDRLKPGMKVIAVSRDMLNKYGMKHRTKVRIKGLDGEYLVLDKMNKRWKKKIDIYMGKDLKKAFKWGRKKVEIEWQ